MKRMIGAVVVAGCVSAGWAQDFEQRAERGGTAASRETRAVPDKPNTIRGEKADVSGVIPHATRSGVNLVNPAAGPEHGDGRDNVQRDVVTGEATGLKLFAWEF
jgi:hypothetical protein